MSDQKKFYRDLKRDIKKAGNRQRRNYLKRALLENPAEAHWDEFEFGQSSSSKWLNGIDEEGRYETNNDNQSKG